MLFGSDKFAQVSEWVIDGVKVKLAMMWDMPIVSTQ